MMIREKLNYDYVRAIIKCQNDRFYIYLALETNEWGHILSVK